MKPDKNETKEVTEVTLQKPGEGYLVISSFQGVVHKTLLTQTEKEARECMNNILKAVYGCIPELQDGDVEVCVQGVLIPAEMVPVISESYLFEGFKEALEEREKHTGEVFQVYQEYESFKEYVRDGLRDSFKDWVNGYFALKEEQENEGWGWA